MELGITNVEHGFVNYLKYKIATELIYIATINNVYYCNMLVFFIIYFAELWPVQIKDAWTHNEHFLMSLKVQQFSSCTFKLTVHTSALY